MALILDGKKLRDEIRTRLANEVKAFSSEPAMAIFQVGDRADSTTYINQKKQFAESIGAKIIHKQYPESVSQAELVKDIEQANKDKNTHGILVQIPLPPYLSRNVIINTVIPTKDVDGLTAISFNKLFEGTSDGDMAGFMSGTSRGILALLDYYKIQIAGKHAVVVGRSTLVGKPAGLALLSHDATVTMAHKESTDLAEITKTADILVVAIGDPEFIDKKYLKPGQVVIDVGINAVDGKIKGDVNFADAEKIVEAISPVPGGVGPLTVACLFENLIDAYRSQI